MSEIRRLTAEVVAAAAAKKAKLAGQRAATSADEAQRAQQAAFLATVSASGSRQSAEASERNTERAAGLARQSADDARLSRDDAGRSEQAAQRAAADAKAAAADARVAAVKADTANHNARVGADEARKARAATAAAADGASQAARNAELAAEAARLAQDAAEKTQGRRGPPGPTPRHEIDEKTGRVRWAQRMHDDGTVLEWGEWLSVRAKPGQSVQYVVGGGGGGSATDFFSNKTTDANGDVVLTLGHTPTSDADIFVVCNNTRRVASFQSRLGAAVTVRVHKLAYDKPVTPIGTPSDLPAGVTVDATASGFALTSTAAQSPAINPTTGVAGAGADDATHQHIVTVDKLTSHKHGLTFTETAQAAAATESGLNFVVIYK